MQPTVPLAVGFANLGNPPKSQIGDPTTEQFIRDFYRRNGGRWNRITQTIPPGGVLASANANSRNVRVSNVLVRVFPIVPAGAVNVEIWERVSAVDPNTSGTPDFVLNSTEPQQWPGLDDRTYWAVRNVGGDPIAITIFYQEAGV